MLPISQNNVRGITLEEKCVKENQQQTWKPTRMIVLNENINH